MQRPWQFPSVSWRRPDPHEQLKMLVEPTADENTLVVTTDVRLTLYRTF
jgi:hypothetical protein